MPISGKKLKERISKIDTEIAEIKIEIVDEVTILQKKIDAGKKVIREKEDKVKTLEGKKELLSELVELDVESDKKSKPSK